MALATAWWMKPLQTASRPRPQNPDRPHLDWPWNRPQVGISFHNLNQYLSTQQTNTSFSVHKFAYATAQWKHSGEFIQIGKLLNELRADQLEQDDSTILYDEPHLFQSVFQLHSIGVLKLTSKAPASPSGFTQKLSKHSVTTWTSRRDFSTFPTFL